MKVAILVLFLAAAEASRVTSRQCEVGDWSEWSEWREQENIRGVRSFPAPDKPDAENDWGRKNFQMMKEIKLKQREEKRQCKLDGTCPELAAKKADGRVDCIGGIIETGGEPCWNIDQLYFIPHAECDPVEGINFEGNDAWGWTDPITGEDYAFMGMEHGVSFVRMTPRESPLVVGFMATETTATTWRDFKTVDDYLYIVSEANNHGMQVFDMNRLRGVNTFQDFLPDSVYTGVGNCHNIVANDDTNRLFLVGCTQAAYEGCAGGLHIVDVTDPKTPVFAGCFSGDGYTHDAQCVVYSGPDVNYQGKEVCFAFNEDTLTIVDTTDPSATVEISRSGYLDAQYCHQGWLTQNQDFILLDDELDEYPAGLTKTYFWDVRNLRDPLLMNTIVHPRNSIDHNQYVVGDLTFQANYETGLRILRIDTTDQTLTEVAYFDVFPSDDRALFFGSWSVYPYYPNRDVIISSIDFGLYIVRPNYGAMDAVTKNKAERTRFRNILSKSDNCPATFEVEHQ